MFLCFNTAIPDHHIALIDKKRGAVVIENLQTGQEAETILASIDRLFKKTNASPQKLTGIMAITGPGGFTSLRIGLTVANQFAHQLNLRMTALRAEEWYKERTEEKDFIYLQSLNREEIYAVGFGKSKFILPEGVIRESRLLENKNTKNRPQYLGSLLAEHKKALESAFSEIKKLHSPKMAWLRIAESADPNPRQKEKYHLLEPFYGKTPTITKPKKL